MGFSHLHDCRVGVRCKTMDAVGPWRFATCRNAGSFAPCVDSPGAKPREPAPVGLFSDRKSIPPTFSLSLMLNPSRKGCMGPYTFAD